MKEEIKEVRKQSIMGAVAIIVYCILETAGLSFQNPVFENIALYCQTLAFVTVIMILVHTTGLINKMQKRREASALSTKIEKLPKILQMTIVIIMAFGIAIILKFFLNSLGL